MTSLSSTAPLTPAAFAAQSLSSPRQLAAVIDHTLLKPDATHAHVLQLCREAAEHGFACAMVNPTWAEAAVQALAGTGIPVGAVVGFPLGSNSAETKLAEAEQLLRAGVHDVDVVLNVGRLKSGRPEDLRLITSELRSLADRVHAHGGILKVILETCLLSFEEKLRAADLVLAAGADFLKTSTGFSSGGATVDDIHLLHDKAAGQAEVKASGGIRSLADATSMLRAGATRIGASASVRILHELAGQHAPASTADSL